MAKSRKRYRSKPNRRRTANACTKRRRTDPIIAGSHQQDRELPPIGDWTLFEPAPSNRELLRRVTTLEGLIIGLAKELEDVKRLLEHEQQQIKERHELISRLRRNRSNNAGNNATRFCAIQ